jgi:hypothetical protein
LPRGEKVCQHERVLGNDGTELPVRHNISQKASIFAGRSIDLQE